MKKIIKLFIGVILLLFFLILFMVVSDRKYIDNMSKKIINKTLVEKVNYINKYGNYYIVMDDGYLYLIDNKYQIITKKDKILIYDNKNNYDIIYKNDDFMYFNDYYKDDELVYEYYSLYTYELIDRVFVGGNYGK